MAEKPIALLDACVLYSSYLRDFLMRLGAEDQLFHARWSEKILSEWVENLLAAKPNLARGVLERTIYKMNLAIPDALVVIDDVTPPTEDLPDENDRHVLTAAIAAGAEYIVTFNLRDFPKMICEKFGISPVHPDVFIMTLLSTNVFSVHETILRQIKWYKNPPMTSEELLTALEKTGITHTAKFIRTLLGNA